MHVPRRCAHEPRVQEKPNKSTVIVTQASSLNEDDSATLPTSKGSWKPVPLRTTLLILVIFTSLALATSLQILLLYSQRKHGVFLASKLSDLSPAQTFAYMYLPTIISVLFGLCWSWIDLAAKRLEPYRQLSKPNGATAEDSLLLHYASDFLPTVPLKALRRRHWPVFLASTALVLVSWGVTPLQAAIFATRAIKLTTTNAMQVSTSYIPIDAQESQVAASYTYSVYGITWLNESLPPYMSLEVALAPFRLHTGATMEEAETWIGDTTLYSVDVSCETATLGPRSLSSGGDYLAYTSSQGCEIPYPYGPTGNDTIGGSGSDEVKRFAALYAGFGDDNGFADYYLSQDCPANASHVLLASFAENKLHDNATATTPTVIFCEPTYYQQNVTATIRAIDRSILNVTTVGAKQALPPDMINVTQLEWQMNSATEELYTRGPVPAKSWPDQTERLSSLPISPPVHGAKIPMMVGMALGALKRPMEDYLDPMVLGQSYEAAYRLLFARAMVDILTLNDPGARVVTGSRSYTMESVYMVPGFTYAVEALLIVVSILASALLVFTCFARISLEADPGSMSALMRLVADDSVLLATFAALEGDHEKTVHHALHDKRFALEWNDSLFVLRQSGNHSSSSQAHRVNKPEPASWKARATRWELRSTCGVIFFLIHLALLVTLICTLTLARPMGLALPSPNRFVRQFLESYIPTAIATLIEPAWVLLARLLCTLQPLEVLRKGDAPAARSIDIDYLASPPQVAVLGAFMQRHLRLSAVCFMALLANVLAVAFSGLFNETTLSVPRPMNMTQPYQTLFKDIDGSIGPESKYTSAYIGSGLDQFYIAMSNLSAHTAVPAWSDDHAFYVPVDLPVGDTNGESYRISTRAFGAKVDCQELIRDGNMSWQLNAPPSSPSNADTSTLRITSNRSDNRLRTCSAGGLSLIGPQTGHACPEGRTAMELVTAMSASMSASVEDRDYCRQLIVSGWFTSSAVERCSIANTTNDEPLRNETDHSATVMACRPQLTSQMVDLVVNGDGIVESAVSTSQIEIDLQHYFAGDPGALLQRVSNFIIGNAANYGRGSGGTWHNDSLPSDWNNYIMQQIARNSSLLDPATPPPDFGEIAPLFSEMYTKLFAIWLTLNHGDFLLQANASTARIPGHMLQVETRIVVSFTMSIIAGVTLALFLLTLAIVYLSRPGRCLRSVPTSMASTICMFAASRAVRDMRSSAASRIAGGRVPTYTYGYGTFVGVDGQSHVGVERATLVQVS